VTTLPLTMLVGLMLGLVLSRWVPSLEPVERSGQSLPPDQLPHQASLGRSATLGLRLYLRLREAMVPMLTLAIGLWLPATLCIYREAPDWSLMYLLGPERAVPVVLAGLFTLQTVSVPLGVGLGLLAELRFANRLGPRPSRRLGQLPGRLTVWLVVLLLLVMMLAICHSAAERLLWVGTYADFHDGRWLLAPLGPSSPRLFTVLLLANLVVAAGAVATGSAMSRRAPSLPTLSPAAPPMPLASRQSH